jgi:hypothetical protein
VQYALLIYTNEKADMARPEAEQQAEFAEYMKFTNRIVERGILRAGEALQPTTTATTVRVKDGKRLTTDGPFAETREQLGGFYIIDVPNLDEAIAVAETLPSARYGSIEVRPVMVFER